MGTLRIGVADSHVCGSECYRRNGRHGSATPTPMPRTLGPVPKPPDYSTRAKVSARARERGTGEGADIRAAGKDKTFAGCYRQFRAVAPARPCPVEDWHTPNRIVLELARRITP